MLLKPKSNSEVRMTSGKTRALGFSLQQSVDIGGTVPNFSPPLCCIPPYELDILFT